MDFFQIYLKKRKSFKFATVFCTMTMHMMCCWWSFLQCKNQPPLPLTPARPVITVEDDRPEQNDDDRMDVETELYLGLPGKDPRRNKVAEVRSG